MFADTMAAAVVVLVGGALGAIAPLHQSCGVETASVCNHDGDAYPTVYETEYVTGDHCLQCTANHCNSSQPATGLMCRPWLKQCAMCGDPEMR